MKLLNCKYQYIFCCFYLLIACPIVVQAQQKDLEVKDYHLWSRLNLNALSDKGNWVSYSLSYANNDTLFVKSKSGKITYNFPLGTNGMFIDENWFVCIEEGQRLVILNLKNNSVELIDKIGNFAVSSDRLHLILHQHEADDKKKLIVRDFEGNTIFKVNEVTTYSFNKFANSIVFETKEKDRNKVGIINLGLKTMHTIINDKTKYSYSDFVWQNNGKAVAYIIHEENYKQTKIGLYRLLEKEYFEFIPESFKDFPNDKFLTASTFANLIISNDGKRIFFGLSKKEDKVDLPTVQIWNTTDKNIYPLKKEIAAWDPIPKVAMWSPDTDNFKQLSNNILPYLMLSGDQKFALLSDPLLYEPQNELFGSTDYYLMDLETGKQKILLIGQSSEIEKTVFSPGGKYLSYFQNGDWWVYDLLKETNQNLTKGTELQTLDSSAGWPGKKPSFGCPGWTENDKEMMVYDQYDVWKINILNQTKKRLTKGKESNSVYRIIPQESNQGRVSNFGGLMTGVFNLSQGLLLSVRGTEKSGYSWLSNENVLGLVLEENGISQAIRSRQGNHLIYLQQSYNLPPRLVMKTVSNSKMKVLCQSNPQQNIYKWGIANKIVYHNLKGKKLNGILYYPAGFDPKVKYPMIVRIYEKQSSGYNNYINPSEYNNQGFNISNLLTKGYFVLLPDIEYELGNPGISALDCVTSAVAKVLIIPNIDEKNIGLIGHSFGGYETNFIISQTNIFASAVVGAGVSDLTANYLFASLNNGKPNYWRLESGQYRMGVSLFDNIELYRANSPLAHVKNVTTPLLTWSGINDKQVFYHQSLAFHLALRRLVKENIMLLYEEEEHVIQKKENQTDLTKRIEDWFGYYLKKESTPEWLKPNILH